MHFVVKVKDFLALRDRQPGTCSWGKVIQPSRWEQLQYNHCVPIMLLLMQYLFSIIIVSQAFSYQNMTCHVTSCQQEHT